MHAATTAWARNPTPSLGAERLPERARRGGGLEAQGAFPRSLGRGDWAFGGAVQARATPRPRADVTV